MGTCKFDSMIGQYEIKCHPHDLTGDVKNVKNLKVCVINTVSVYHAGGISLQRVKVHQNPEVMSSVAF